MRMHLQKKNDLGLLARREFRQKSEELEHLNIETNRLDSDLRQLDSNLKQSEVDLAL